MFEKTRRFIGGFRQALSEGIRVAQAARVSAMDVATRLWLDMYLDRPPWKGADVKTLALPSMIAAKIARLATLEMKSEVVGGSERAVYLQGLYEMLRGRARVMTEYAAAMGNIVIKPYVTTCGGIAFDIIKPDYFRATGFSDDGGVKTCVFASVIQEDARAFVRLETHSVEPDGVHITNRAYVSNVPSIDKLAMFDDPGGEVALTRVPQWAALEPEVVIQASEPLFAMFSMPYANTIDAASPLGVSVYSRATSLIEEADRQYSRLLWELESGNRALYVDVDAIKPDGRDRRTNIGTDRIRRLYRSLEISKDEGLFKEWSPSLRVTEQADALNEIIKRIEDAVGLSRGSFSDTPESGGGGAKTVAEILSLRQETYSSIVDVQSALEHAVKAALVAADTWATVYNLAPQGAWDIAFEFDDSVVSDRAAQFMEHMQLLAANIMSKEEVRAWYMGEPIETARQNLPAPPKALELPPVPEE